MPPLNTFAAVADPDRPDVITFWWIDECGQIHDYPRGTRWRPVPPRVPLELRSTRGRQAWYDEVYFPWKATVIAAIDADPTAALARFLDRYPNPQAPVPVKPLEAPVRRESARRKREVGTLANEAVLAHSLAVHGATLEEIARALGLSEPTAKRRADVGEIMARARAEVLHENRLRLDPIAQALADALRQWPAGQDEPLPDEAQRLIAALLARPTSSAIRG